MGGRNKRRQAKAARDIFEIAKVAGGGAGSQASMKTNVFFSYTKVLTTYTLK